MQKLKRNKKAIVLGLGLLIPLSLMVELGWFLLALQVLRVRAF